jgi:hypothetical protein
LWQGLLPPQFIFANRRFLGIALDPPDCEPGSWVGAGNCTFDPDGRRFLLTSRPRKAAGNVRGYAADIHTSADGVTFDLLHSVPKEEVCALSGLDVHSIEGTQLLRDPLTGDWHFYLSANTDSEFVWGGLHWETLLLTARDLTGPWKSRGIVLPTGQGFDRYQARDSSIGIVDGQWRCLYKARDTERTVRPALAVSTDGVTWQKLGPLTIDGQDRHVFLNGTLFAGATGVVYVGLEKADPFPADLADEEQADTHGVAHGAGPRRHFAAYGLDRQRMDLETIFSAPWEPGSEYEHPDHPLLGYSSLVWDPVRSRMLIYVEAIDPKLTVHMGLNGTVERLLVYEAATKPSGTDK